LRHALSLRPGSARTWTALATVKQRLGQIDAELGAAVGYARRFGPREPGVQAALTIICTSAGAPIRECPPPGGSFDKGLSRNRL
jgi:hypothetical protein